MITQWGMSEKLGPISFGEREEQIFLGREIQQHQDYSEKTAQAIDEEVKSMIMACYDRAHEILQNNEDILHSMAEALLERETLDKEEIDLLLARKPLPETRRTSHETSADDKEKEVAPEEPADSRPEFPGGTQPFPRPDTP